MFEALHCEQFLSNSKVQSLGLERSKLARFTICQFKEKALSPFKLLGKWCWRSSGFLLHVSYPHLPLQMQKDVSDVHMKHWSSHDPDLLLWSLLGHIVDTRTSQTLAITSHSLVYQPCIFLLMEFITYTFTPLIFNKKALGPYEKEERPSSHK